MLPSPKEMDALKERETVARVAVAPITDEVVWGDRHCGERHLEVLLLLFSSASPDRGPAAASIFCCCC